MLLSGSVTQEIQLEMYRIMGKKEAQVSSLTSLLLSTLPIPWHKALFSGYLVYPLLKGAHLLRNDPLYPPILSPPSPADVTRVRATRR
jgi:hypothetical protein